MHYSDIKITEVKELFAKEVVEIDGIDKTEKKVLVLTFYCKHDNNEVTMSLDRWRQFCWATAAEIEEPRRFRRFQVRNRLIASKIAKKLRRRDFFQTFMVPGVNP